MSSDPLEQILGAVRIHPDGSFTFPPGAPAVRAKSFVAALTDAIYSSAFARGFEDNFEDNEQEDNEQPEDPTTESELVRRLSEANQSRDHWLDGWRIEQVNEDGSIVATQDRRQRIASPGQYSATFARDLPPRAGMAVTILFPCQSLTLQSHVYYAFGEALPSADGDESRPARIYIQAPVDALPELYERLTGEFNRLALPFTMKTMLKPVERARRDATVLYVEREQCSRVEAVIDRLPKSLRARLGPGVPLFTRRLGPGIGMAESPGDGEGFGMQRSRLVAEGIADAWSAGRQDVEERLRAVQRRFQAAGVDWNQPHLAPIRIVLTTNNVADWLRSQGIAGGGEWHVSDRSSRNRNFAVARADGSGYFIKQLRVQGPASLRMMERESAIYEAAAANDSLKQLLPPFVRFDRGAQAVIFELVPGAQCVALLPDRGSSIEIARAAARTLALLHRQPPFASELASDLLDQQPPGIYTAHRGGSLLQWLAPGQLQIIDLVRMSPILAPALDRMAAEWRVERPIHGDVKWENCLRTAEGELRWIDWELAGNGDPLWDAGCFVQTYIAQSITSQSPLNLEALDAFVDAYNAGARAPIIRCAAARLIQSSLEVMHGRPAPTPIALAFFNAAERIMASGL